MRGLDTIEGCLRYCGEQLHWPVSHMDGLVFLQALGGVGVLMMPTGLGEEVGNRLRLYRRRGPVVQIPGRPTQWAFVVSLPPARPAQVVTPPGVRFLRGGARLALPPSVVPGGEVRWVVPPASGMGLPSFADVLAAARAALTVRRR